MPELRWILAAIGLVVVVGVYLYSRHRAQRDSLGETDALSRIEPTLEADSSWPSEPGPLDPGPSPAEIAADAEPADAIVDREPAAVEDAAVPTPAPEPVPTDPQPAVTRPSADTQTIVALQLRANPGETYAGSDLFAAFEAQRLRFGRLEAFHRLDADGETVFTVANLVNPGTFDPGAAEQFATRGVALFMLVPGEGDDVATLDAMIDCARGLADVLGGEVCDESGCTFTAQLEAHLREEIVQLRHQARVGTARRGSGV